MGKDVTKIFHAVQERLNQRSSAERRAATNIYEKFFHFNSSRTARTATPSSPPARVPLQITVTSYMVSIVIGCMSISSQEYGSFVSRSSFFAYIWFRLF